MMRGLILAALFSILVLGMSFCSAGGDDDDDSGSDGGDDTGETSYLEVQLEGVNYRAGADDLTPFEPGWENTGDGEVSYKADAEGSAGHSFDQMSIEFVDFPYPFSGPFATGDDCFHMDTGAPGYVLLSVYSTYGTYGTFYCDESGEYLEINITLINDAEVAGEISGYLWKSTDHVPVSGSFDLIFDELN